jgi:hypothetical protein
MDTKTMKSYLIFLFYHFNFKNFFKKVLTNAVTKKQKAVIFFFNFFFFKFLKIIEL